MRNPALHLSFDDQRVDLRTTVVDRHVLRDRHFTGLAVHVDRADVGAEGEREVLRLEEARCLEARFEIRRQILRDVRFARKLRPPDLARRHAGRPEDAALELHVIGRGFEQMRRQTFRFRDDLVDAHDDGGPADRRAAAAVRVAAVVGDVRVAVQNDDVLDRDADPVRDDLRERGLLALTVRGDAGDDGDFRGYLHPHATPFPAARRHRLRRPHRADLHVGRHADARQPACGARRVTVRDQPFPPDELARLHQGALIIAAVVHEPAGGRKREFTGRGEVLQAEVDAIDPAFVRDDVHQPLDEISGLGPSRTPVRIGRHFVGVDADDFHRRNPVAAGQHETRERRHGRRQKLQIRAEVRDRTGFEAENGAVLLDCDLILANLIAAVRRYGRVLAPRFDPFHGRVQAHGEMRAQRFFRVHVELRAEAATHFRRDDPQFVFGHANHGGQQRAKQVRDLCRRPERQRLFAGLIRGHNATRLDRHRRQTLMVEPMLDDLVGFSECLVDVCTARHHMCVRDVRSEIRMGQRRAALDRCFGIRHGGQRVVIDVDRIDRIARDVWVDRDHDRHRMADKIDAVAGEHRMPRRLQIRNRRGAGNGAARSVHVSPG